MGSSTRNFVLFLLLPACAATPLAQQSPPPTAGQAAPATAANGAPASAQPQSEHVEGTATVLKVKTRLVIVDVIALDHKGAPVTDLKADDFTLQEENQPQKIRVFNFQQGVQGQPGVLTPVTLSSSRITNMPRFKTNSTLNVLLLDGINVTNANQKYAREQMLKFLEKLPAGQPLAVYAMGTKLRMLQDFTVDPELLKEAVKKSRSNALGVRSQSSNAIDLPPGTMQAMPDAMLQQVLRFGQEQAINQMDERVRLTIEQLSALARNLSGYPGRKNLIWVSEAFPAYLFPEDPDPRGRSSTAGVSQLPNIVSYQGQISHASDLLANAQVAVYPVDAGAVGNHDAYSSLSNTDNNGNYLGNSARGSIRNGMGGSAQASEISNASVTTMNSHSTMNTVAEQTGGKAFYNTNDLNRAIRDSMEDGSTYYTLGYYPENKNWDSRFRRISVKVNRPGVKLHYRQGFYAVEPREYAKQDPKIMAVDIGSALDINNPISTGLPFQAVVLPPTTQNNKLQINFGIDPHAIGFELKEDGLQHAAVDCGVRAYSKSGESIKLQGNTFNAALAPEQYQKVMKAIFPCNQTLELPPGEYLLRLAVRDTNNGLIGTANGRATVPPSGANSQASPEEKKP
jgi:VWFA-related protein